MNHEPRILSQGIRIDATGRYPRVYDRETGKEIEYVISIDVKVDADGAKATVTLVCPVDYEGPAELYNLTAIADTTPDDSPESRKWSSANG